MTYKTSAASLRNALTTTPYGIITFLVRSDNLNIYYALRVRDANSENSTYTQTKEDLCFLLFNAI